jgi:glycosyltransferase involved in cell wall biosynthesis
MQKTDFKYEILIHEDASTDKTAEIIKDFQNKHSEIIKPIYQTENQYSKGKKINSTFNFPRARGKYIALCEGDDYWTDPTKLQKQYDFLERNPDIVCCYHNALIVDDKGVEKGSKLPPEQQRSHSSYEMMTGESFILTMSSFFRNTDIVKNYPIESKFIKNGDTFLFSLLGQYGSGKYLADIKPAVYRVHSGGVWSSISEAQKNAQRMNTFYWLAEYYGKNGNNPNVENELRWKCISMATLDMNISLRLNLMARLAIGILPASIKSRIKKILR